MARDGGLQSNSIGEVAEWSIAAVLKTVDPRGSVGSNPTLSANVPLNIPSRPKFSGRVLFQRRHPSRPFLRTDLFARHPHERGCLNLLNTLSRAFQP